jgi:inner membrane protein
MEPITQGLLGAAVAQAGFAHRLGRRALFWGALVGMAPDLDVLAAPLHGGFGELLYHRGTTHSLWFGGVVGPPLGWLLWRWRDSARETRRRETAAHAGGLSLDSAREGSTLSAWIGLCVLALVTHPLLDAFTTYGTQLFAPFWRERFAWNGVGIIDPTYTAILAVAVAIGVRSSIDARRRRIAATCALALSTLYLLGGVELNRRAERDVRTALDREGLVSAEVAIYPTVFQPFLRRLVVRTPNEVRVGLHTCFRPGESYWQSFTPPPAHPLVERLEATWEGSLFVWFASGQVTARTRSLSETTVVEIEDLRYALPGFPPDEGLWGIRARFDASGARIGPVERYGRRRTGRIAPVLVEMWNATWGDFSGLPRGL